MYFPAMISRLPLPSSLLWVNLFSTCRKHFSLVALVLMLAPLSTWGQARLEWGPVTGAVMPKQARIKTAASKAPGLKLVYYPLAAVSQAETLRMSRDMGDTLVFEAQLARLKPHTRYQYHIMDMNDRLMARAQFRTAPPADNQEHFRFGYISCFRGGDTPLPGVEQLMKTDPHFVLNVGDWGYYDTTDHFPQDTNVFPLKAARVQQAYFDRYTQDAMPTLLRQTSLAYTWDDHDWQNDNASAHHFTIYQDKKQQPQEVPFPKQARTNSHAGYRRYVPHYPLEQPGAESPIYQRFRWGPAEFFILDTRSNRTPNTGALKQVNGQWHYQPSSENQCLGTEQLQWLLDGLKNSDATWKFVVTSIAFNTGLENYVHQALALKDQELKILWYKFPAENLTSILMDSWPGFAVERDLILNHCRKHDIRNLIFLSGDTHIAAMDDGSNAGFPELMSGGMTRGSKAAYWLSRLFKTNVWNTYAQGKAPSKVRDAFGLVDVHGADSVTLKTVDERGEIIGQHTYYPELTAAPDIVMTPAVKSHAWLDFTPEIQLHPLAVRLQFDRFPRRFAKAANLVVRKPDGEPVLNKVLERRFRRSHWEHLGALHPGYYFVGVESIEGKFYRRVWIGRK